MYCLVTKSSPCRATPYPFKCVGLHVFCKCKHALLNVQILQFAQNTKKKKKNSVLKRNT